MTSQTMTSLPTATTPDTLSITAVEQETRIAKDTLRVWEKRYGFPNPLRDSSQERLYPMEQVERLKRIRLLLDMGYRPGKVAHLEDEELQKLIDRNTNLSKTKIKNNSSHEELEALLRHIETHNTSTLRSALQHALIRKGLAPFVTQLVAPLTTAVGMAWAQSRFDVFEEHLYTEVITNVLRSCLSTLTTDAVMQPPRVLLTTIPQESHGLGLLMVQALLTVEGCDCISLGTQTPASDIVRAAAAHQVDIVALSFTNLHNASTVQNTLRDLRKALPATTEIWAGGSCASLYLKPLEGITTQQSLDRIAELVAQWRQTHQTGSAH